MKKHLILINLVLLLLSACTPSENEIISKYIVVDYDGMHLRLQSVVDSSFIQNIPLNKEHLGPEIKPVKGMKVSATGDFKKLFFDIRQPLLSIHEQPVLLASYTTVPPQIDGVLNDSCWKSSKTSSFFQDIEGKNKKNQSREPLPTTVQACWDNDNLYLAATLVEPHICAELTARDTVIFYDNDFEIFLDPDQDNHAYAEIEMNALNTVWDLLLTKPYKDQGLALTSWDIPNLKTAVNIEGTLNRANDIDSAWYVELAIPFKSLGACGVVAKPKLNDVWNVNFSRVQWEYDITQDCQYNKRPHTPEYNWVWSPTGIVAIHHPERWGKLQFVDTPKTSIKTDIIVSELHDIYYAQVCYYQNVGRYAKNIEELTTWVDLPPQIQTRGYQLEQTTQGWRATFFDPQTGKRYRIIQDARLEITK